MEAKDMIKEAAEFAEQAHKGEFRRDGKTPYFIHVQRVAGLVEAAGGSEIQIAIAYLHDTIENHPEKPLGKEIGERFGEEVLKGVSALTREKTRDYGEYIVDLKKRKDLLLVKACDMVDNLSDDPTPAQKIKYVRALMKLIG